MHLRVSLNKFYIRLIYSFIHVINVHTSGNIPRKIWYINVTRLTMTTLMTTILQFYGLSVWFQMFQVNRDKWSFLVISNSWPGCNRWIKWKAKCCLTISVHRTGCIRWMKWKVKILIDQLCLLTCLEFEASGFPSEQSLTWLSLKQWKGQIRFGRFVPMNKCFDILMFNWASCKGESSLTVFVFMNK